MRPPRKKSNKLHDRHTILWWRILSSALAIGVAAGASVGNLPEETTKYSHGNLIQSTLYVDEPATNYLDLDEVTTLEPQENHREDQEEISYNLIDSDENAIQEDDKYFKQRTLPDLNNESEINQNNTNYNDTTSTITTEKDNVETTTILETTTLDEDYHLEETEEEQVVNKSMMEPTIDMGPINAFRDIATGFVESLVERIVPQGLRDLFRRMQNQNEQLETIRLRSREENGGLGQFGRSLLKNLATPFNQLMQGVRDYGSLDSDKNFLAGVASGVASVADGVSDAFKDRVKAIYPGTLWCGDGHIGKEDDVGLFFMTDRCCRRHDSCKMWILAGETKFGLTNTGIFSRTHCECDKAFYKCLKKTNSLISNQVGVTFFSILGPQCFRKDYPIIKCARRTRITGQKCEEYLLDYTQPKMWQWFDNETF